MQCVQCVHTRGTPRLAAGELAADPAEAEAEHDQGRLVHGPRLRSHACARKEGVAWRPCTVHGVCNTVVRSACVQRGVRSAAWRGVVRRGVVCGVVWCGVVRCGVVWCGVVWCGVVWCSVGLT